MRKTNPAIDKYIKSKNDFARPILQKLREIVHKADPDLREEIKWGAPCFSKNRMVCGIWGFMQHVDLVFFEGSLMSDSLKLFNYGKGNLKNRTIKFENVAQVSETEILKYVREAVRLDDEGKRVEIPVSKDKKVVIPPYIKKALEEGEVLKKYEALPYFKRKGYVEWIEGAILPETKQKRINQMVEELPRGVYMNDRY